MAIFGTTSYAAPLLLTSLFFVFFIIAFGKPLRCSRSYYYIIFFSSVSVVGAFIFSGQPIVSKQIMSLPTLGICGVAISSVLTMYFWRNDFVVAKDLNRAYVIVAVVGIASLVFPVDVLSYAHFPKPVFPFSEPSHYALAYGQIAAMVFPFLSKRRRFLVIFIGFGLGALFPNLTILVTALLLLALVASYRLLLAAVLFIALVFYLNINSEAAFLNYITSRVGVGGERNISGLVYLQGWQSIYSALSSTGLLGIGFQNLGNEPLTDAGISIMAMNDDSALNRSDGGFLLAKFVGEFGVIGLVVSAIYIYFVTKAFSVFRKLSKADFSPEVAVTMIPVTVLYISIIEVLVRGVGYFSPSILITIALAPSAIITLKNRRSI